MSRAKRGGAVHPQHYRTIKRVLLEHLTSLPQKDLEGRARLAVGSPLCCGIPAFPLLPSVRKAGWDRSHFAACYSLRPVALRPPAGASWPPANSLWLLSSFWRMPARQSREFFKRHTF